MTGGGSGAGPYAAAPVGWSLSPLRDRARQSRQGDLARLHAQAWKDLITGNLQTRKAAYTTTLRMLAANAATQKITGYATLTGGSGGNTTITADKGFVTACTAVYNLTADPGRVTNLLTNFYRNTQQVVLSAAPALNDDLELQCTILPYQGIYAYSPPANLANTLFEVIDFDDTVHVTSSGTGGSANASASLRVPAVPKLPLPTSGAVTSDSYLADSVQPSPNYSTAGADPRSADLRDNQERVPITSHDESGSVVRFRRGLRFYVAGTGTRGAAQTVPQTNGYTWPMGGNAGGWPTKHLTVIHALVRVVDSLYADATTYPIGRVFLFVSSRANTSSGGQVGTVSGGVCANDLYPLDPVTDFYDGMVTL